MGLSEVRKLQGELKRANESTLLVYLLQEANDEWEEMQNKICHKQFELSEAIKCVEQRKRELDRLIYEQSNFTGDKPKKKSV